MFQEIKRKKKSHKIISQIRESILQGKLKHGDKLPSEKELVDQLNVSKHTLREALSALEEMGLIELRQGINGGAYIAKVEIDVAQYHLVNYLYSRNLTPNHLSELRKLIEPYAAKIVADKITDEQLKIIKDMNDRARFFLENNQLEKAVKNEYALHKYIADLTGNPLLILIIDFAERTLKEFKQKLGADERFYTTVLERHERIYKALEERDATKAGNEMLGHVKQVEEGLTALEEKIDLKKVNALTSFWDNKERVII